MEDIMKDKRLFALFLVLLLVYALPAQQERSFPKASFDIFPQPQHQISRLDGKSESRSRQLIWAEDFEANPNWALEQNWAIGTPSFGPNYVAQGTSCLATGLDSMYANDANIIAQSPDIVLPPASYVELSFSEWFELENGWDYAYVEVLTGAYPNYASYTIDARTGSSGFSYRTTALNLTQFQNQSIKLRFHLDSDSSVPAAGWYIDELSITAVEPLPLDLQILGVNHSHYPSVYLNASVNSPQGLVTDLNTANFSVLENGALQEDMFTVISPDEEQVSGADIIFVLDVTGSMSDEINAVRNNMTNFINQLQSEAIDYRIGFVVFGDIVYVYNQYQFYTEFSEIQNVIQNINLGEHGIGSGGDFPENQVEAMAQAAQFSWRPGATRNMILLTDATSHESDNVTEWTMGNLLAQLLLPNNIVVFPIFNVQDPTQMTQYLPIAEQTNPQGNYYHIYDNFNAIINQIGTFITSQYTVHYNSMVPMENPITRLVTLEVQRDNMSSDARVFYIPGIAPLIQRSNALIALDMNSVNTGQSITFTVELTDRLAPYIIEKKLCWRRSNQDDYSILDFTQLQGNTYQAILPAAQVHGTAIEYYIEASDGQTTNTLPSSTPDLQPYCIAINPADHAQFQNLNQEYQVGTSFYTSLNCLAANSVNIDIFYRPIGSLVYSSVPMNPGTGNTYTVSISDDLGNLGIEYYFLAQQSNGVSTFYGLLDEPLTLYAQAPSPIADPPSISSLRVYPNPLNPRSNTQTSFAFENYSDHPVRLEIFNMRGQKVRSLGPLQLNKGKQIIGWDGKDAHKQRVSSGIYMYRLVTDKASISGKILVSK